MPGQLDAGAFQQPAAPYYCSESMPPLPQPDPTAQPFAVANNGFMAIPGLEMIPDQPYAGTFQQLAAPYYAGANMPPPRLPIPAAQRPAVANTGFAPDARQEMQVEQPPNPLKRKYGVDALFPHEIPGDQGQYMPKKRVGKQKRPQKKRRVDHEPEQPADPVEPEQPADNQEPTADAPQSPQKGGNRTGAIRGRQQWLKQHRRRCFNPAAGCDSSCDLATDQPKRFEQLRTTPSKKCPHLPPEHQVQLWDHLEQ